MTQDLIDVSQDVEGKQVQGFVSERFQPVYDAFVENFRTRNEGGASVCLTYQGETVVDLWGGYRDIKTKVPWEEDTLVVVFSSTKGATAFCAHVLIDRGDLDLNAPMADYWPEFSCAGKEDATVAMALDHSVGVPAVREKLKPGAFYDWDYMAERVAAEEAFWQPGTRLGYHAVTFGWTVGELVRRVSGKSLGTFFKDEIADPLGIDFWIGAPADVEPRIATLKRNLPPAGDPQSRFIKKVLTDPSSPSSLFILNNGGAQAGEPAYWQAEQGAGSGLTNGRGLAGLYAPLANGGAHQGTQFVGSNTLARMGRVAMATHEDATLAIPTRFALGFMKSIDNRGLTSGDNVPMESVILSDAAFGHVGMGGSLGFADPQENLSFGYAMNNMGLGILLNDRGQSLVDAAYQSLGFTTNVSGVWMR